MPVKPIAGMLRRGLVLDLSVAFENRRSPSGDHGLIYRLLPDEKQYGRYSKNLWLTGNMIIGLGTSVAYFYWYGYHIPAVRTRDRFYAKLEDDRAEAAGA